MSITLEQREDRSLIRLDGQITLASAEELKNLLLQWLATGNRLELDLTCAESLDITAIQLICAAGREAVRANSVVVARVSDAARTAMKVAGFDNSPGLEIQDEPWPK